MVQATAQKEKQEKFTIKHKRPNAISLVMFFKRFSWNTTSFQKMLCKFYLFKFSYNFLGQDDLENQLIGQTRRV